MLREIARFVLLVFALGVLGVFSNPHTSHCQDHVHGLDVALADAMRLPGGDYVRHCRRAPGGCEARAQRLAALFTAAGERHGVDPWLLAAMSVKESGLDSSARGAVGELGLLQLHPRSPWGRRALARIRAGEDADTVVVDEAAALLRAALDRCGSVEAALGAYNSGRCGENAYARRVVALERELRVVAGHLRDDGSGALVPR